MLRVIDVCKDYEASFGTVRALKNVSVDFREREFVSVLGPSGCGKTTLLNLIGGLDVCSAGDIIVDGLSVNDFTEETWNAYRNSVIGFVFQSYNLIPQLTVIENVELALKISGLDKKERRQKAIDALKTVGMDDQCKKKPSELSGGQAQRVAIARALVNDPKVVLADEPTGALDSELGEQIAELLKEISKDRLVITVTHNAYLAEKYSTRIIKMSDGAVVSDSNPIIAEEAGTEVTTVKVPKKKAKKHFRSSFMSPLTALGLSFKNLIKKKKRTALVSVAGSIGILGIGLVLAFSNGINLFLSRMQNSFLASVPIGVYEYSVDYSVLMDTFMSLADKEHEEGDYPNSDVVNLVEANKGSGLMGDMLNEIIDSVAENDVTEEFIEYLRGMNPEWYDSLHEYCGVQMNLIHKGADGTYTDVSPSEVTTNVMNIMANIFGEKGLEKSRWNQIVGDNEFIAKYYDLMAGEWPRQKGDLIIVVNEKNELEIPALKDFGFDAEAADKNGDGALTFDELLSVNSGFELKLVTNDAYYGKTGETLPDFVDVSEYAPKTPDEDMYNSEGAVTLKIVGVLRVKPGSPLRALGANLCYTKELSDYALETSVNSQITAEQKKLLELTGYERSNASALTVLKGKRKVVDKYVDKSILGLLSASLEKTSFMKSFGVDSAPVYINVYPIDLKSKGKITDYVDAWNERGGNVEYFDIAEMFMYNVEIITDICICALLIVASISLIVSSIMIGIITGNSVTERTKEIGILKSLGARRADILTVFISESLIIGVAGSIIGTVLTYAFAPLLSLIAESFCGISGLAKVNPIHSIALIGLGLLLSTISGFLPAFSASKKRVVDALRIE